MTTTKTVAVTDVKRGNTIQISKNRCMVVRGIHRNWKHTNWTVFVGPAPSYETFMVPTTASVKVVTNV